MAIAEDMCQYDCGPVTVYTAAESPSWRWPRQGQEQTRNITCMVMMVVFATDCMPTSIIVYAGSLMLGLPRYLQKHQGQLSRITLSQKHAEGGQGAAT